MKVKELYNLCKLLIKDGNDNYDVTVRLDYERELIKDYEIISTSRKDTGILNLIPNSKLKYK